MTIFSCPIYEDDFVGQMQNSQRCATIQALDESLFEVSPTSIKPSKIQCIVVREYTVATYSTLPASFYPAHKSSASFAGVTNSSSDSSLKLSSISDLDIYSSIQNGKTKEKPTSEALASAPPVRTDKNRPQNVHASTGPPLNSIKLSKSDELAIKMHINKQVGQICDSWSQVRKVALNLKEFIDSKYDINQKWFAYDMLTQKILSQAETQCALQKRSSFSLAAAVLVLFNYFPEFMEYFIGKLKEKCPFIDKGSSCALKSHESRYLEAISGIVHLYAALISYSHGDFSNYKYKVDVAEGWKFVANFLNSKPQVFTSMVLCAFLDIASHSLWRKYGNHFQKLLKTIKDELYPKLPKESTASNESLLLYIESILGGTIDTPDGYIIAE